MDRDDLAFLALFSIFALMFTGTFVLGDASWFLWSLIVPAGLIAKSIDRKAETEKTKRSDLGALSQRSSE